MSKFTIFASRDLPVERGASGWLRRIWESFTGQPNTALLNASKSFEVRVTPAYGGESVYVSGFAAKDGSLTITVEHKGSPRLKWTTRRP